MMRLVLVCMAGQTPLRPTSPVHWPPRSGACSKIVGSNPCESSQRAATSPPGPAPMTATVGVIGDVSHGGHPGAISLIELTGCSGRTLKMRVHHSGSRVERRLGSLRNAAIRKHSAPTKAPSWPSRAFSVIPVLVMKAPTAEAPKAIDPSMLVDAASHNRDFSRTSPTARATATTPRAPLIRKATEPAVSGPHTNSRRSGTRCPHNAAPVLTLKFRVPNNWIADDKHSARVEGISHVRPIAGLLSTSWISAALLKNQEPTKHSRLLASAPQRVANPGAVPIANNDAPTMNSRHWARSNSLPGT